MIKNEFTQPILSFEKHTSTIVFILMFIIYMHIQGDSHIRVQTPRYNSLVHTMDKFGIAWGRNFNTRWDTGLLDRIALLGKINYTELMVFINSSFALQNQIFIFFFKCSNKKYYKHSRWISNVFNNN